MRILLFGATGMVGQGVLRECLRAPDVSQVVTVGRRPLGILHDNLKDVVQSDLFDYSGAEVGLTGFDACFFCLGTSSVGKSEAEYTRITYDLTLAAGTVLAKLNPGMVFIYVSGMGTDSTEEGKSMWARVKGKTENDLRKLDLDAYAFRPGIIQPLHGARSATKWVRAFYAVLGPVLSVVRGIWPNSMLTTEQVGQAMLRVARIGYPKNVLESADIRRAAGATGAADAPTDQGKVPTR